MKRLYILLILLGCLACENSNHSAMNIDGLEANFEQSLEAPATKQSAPPQDQTIDEQITKKVIKTGGVNFESKNIKEDYHKIKELLPKYQAYIENENQSNSTHRINYNLTIRVPSTIYDSLYKSISDFAYRIDSRYSNIDDVTRQYYDLTSRINNKKALEERYLSLLQKATAMKDILAIESQLNEVRTSIESLEGQFNYLSKQISLSTLNISFYEVLPYVYDSNQRSGFGARILSALDGGWQGFLTFMIGLISLWPFVIIVVVGVFTFTKFRGKRKKNKQQNQ